MHPIVQVAAGLYYLFGGAYVLRKLVGPTDYFDVVRPLSSGRPRIDSADDKYGILGFAAGLYSPVRTADSGLFVGSAEAWRVKIPWEVHLRRRVPTDPSIYEASTWLEQAEREHKTYREAGSQLGLKDILRELVPPRNVEFEVRGEWWDENWSDAKIGDMDFIFRGGESFSEITLGEMQRQNELASTSDILLGDGVATPSAFRMTEDHERPIFFHKLYNPSFGVSSNWYLTFKNVRIKGVNGTSDKQLARWFDWTDPQSVETRLGQAPSPAVQDLDLEW